MTKSILLALLAPFMILLAGCKTDDVKKDGVPEAPGLATCLKPTQEQLTIEWGTLENYERQEGTGFKLTSEREIFKVIHRINTEQTLRPAIRVLSNADYCAMAEEVNATFLKVQALHSPGTQGRFIRYSNPPAGVYLRAVWNPELQTFQSRDMRALYDKLMQLVPSDKAAGE